MQQPGWKLNSSSASNAEAVCRGTCPQQRSSSFSSTPAGDTATDGTSTPTVRQHGSPAPHLRPAAWAHPALSPHQHVRGQPSQASCAHQSRLCRATAAGRRCMARWVWVVRRGMHEQPRSKRAGQGVNPPLSTCKRMAATHNKGIASNGWTQTRGRPQTGGSPVWGRVARHSTALRDTGEAPAYARVLPQTHVTPIGQRLNE